MSRQMCPEKVEATPCDCPITTCTLREFRRLKEPGGYERAREEYQQQLRDRAAERESGQEPQDLPYRLQNMGVPHEDIHALRGAVDDSKSVLGAKQFLARERGSQIRFLLLLGDKSIGKSLAAAYVMKQLARNYDWNGQATRTATDPYQWVRASSLTMVDSYDAVNRAQLAGMERCRLLVVDDMGDEGGAVGRSALVQTIFARDDAGRPTVITTNLKVAEFAGKYGDPLMARINARGIVPNLAGEKPRRKKEKPQ